MPRQKRIHFSNALYHVIFKGKHGKILFHDNSDYEKFLDLLKEAISLFGIRIHSYCLMNNHIHLIVQANDKPISQAMYSIAFRFARYYNQVQKMKGQVFQGRYKAKVLTDAAYLLELIRYIHCNPVNANLVLQPEYYKWCSHAEYLINEKPKDWLSTDYILSFFDQNQALARQKLDKFIKTRNAAVAKSKKQHSIIF